MEETNKSNLLNDAIIIAMISVIGYLISYNYEVGYLSYYKIPDKFVQIDITSILKSTGVIIGTLLTLYNMFNVLPAFYPPKKVDGDGRTNPIHDSFRRLFWAFAFSLFIIFFTVFHLTIIYLCIGIIFVISLLEFVFPLLGQRKIKGYKAKLIAARAIDNSVLTLNDVIRNRFGAKTVRIFLILLLIVATIPLVKYIGENRANNQTNYLVINSDKPMVLLYTYQEYFVLAPINLKTKVVTPNFIFVKQEESIEDATIFELMNIGPIKVKKERSS